MPVFLHVLMCLKERKEDKANLYLYAPWRHIVGIEVQLYSFLTSPLFGLSGQLHALATTFPWEGVPVTH